MKEHLYIRNFIKKDQPKKDGTYPLMLVLHTPKCKVSMSVKCSVKLSEWNTVSALPEGNFYAMQQLKELRRILLSIYKIHKIQGKKLSSKDVKDIYLSGNYKTKEYITEYPKKTNRTTILQQTFSFVFKQFIRRRYRLYKIDFSYLPTALWQDFKNYLQEHFYKKYHQSCLFFIGKQLLQLSVKEELKTIIQNHLKGFKFTLTPLEIERLLFYPFKKRLLKIRNAFVFALHTGLSFEVIKNLTRKNYRKISTGEDFLLVRNQYKKLQWVDIGALPKAIQDCCLKTEDFLFPLPSIQKANAYIKEIGEYCTDAKWLTFSTAVFHYQSTS